MGFQVLFALTSRSDEREEKLQRRKYRAANVVGSCPCTGRIRNPANTALYILSMNTDTVLLERI